MLVLYIFIVISIVIVLNALFGAVKFVSEPEEGIEEPFEPLPSYPNLFYGFFTKMVVRETDAGDFEYVFVNNYLCRYIRGKVMIIDENNHPIAEVSPMILREL